MKQSLLFFAVVALLGMSACQQITNSPRMTGTIAGRVLLFDSTHAVLTDFSGITVSIDNTNRSMTTGPDGSWQFDNVDEGTYDLVASKAGFGAYHYYQELVNHGRIDNSAVALSEMPAYRPALDSATWMTWGNSVVLNVPKDYSMLPSGIAIAGYCDLSPNAQPNDAHLMTASNLDSRDGGGIYFSRVDLLAAGARPGQTLYISAANVFSYSAGYSSRYATSFSDPHHNYTTDYASNGPKSNVIVVTMP
jgi:hypothetical protein